MEQDLRTCPRCGAPSSDRSSCPYCGWTPEVVEPSNPSQIASSDGSPEEEVATQASTNEIGLAHQGEDLPQVDQFSPAPFRDLTKEGVDAEHLLDQVPEDMRGVLAARLKAADEAVGSNFSETTASILREQGYVVSEDARGARLTATRGQSDDLSPSEVVKLAADLDGGIQLQTKLPICSNCQAASPIGELQCQWCGEPFSDEQ
jgi:ribosomal protein S27AE